MSIQQQSINEQSINGVVPSALQELIDSVAQDANQGQLAFQATTAWVDGTRSQTQIKSFEWAGQSYARDFTLTIDEPEEWGGTNMGPNPQEVLLSALNACLMATFVNLCSMQGIKLEKVEITSIGKLDLRGFFGLDETISAGYQDLSWQLNVKGNATPEQFQQVYEATMAASPNLWNLAHPVPIKPELRVL
ncbi:OsmC family protein [Leptolyngbya sp. NK1-12]|uniref:OsmC family protein n=1 Tax=Leptolyngbya sp. NK1-12 TaxID=2547451 RepID=A0AA97AEA0_9CYAN|nr:OsmC family protein [Leptolyngbya sp. NK1-12]WNZ21795.1 OsmC family protein [Leptolyngbya sp. NK1-12]